MALLQETGCWVGLFELSHWRGRHGRLLGTSDFRAIRSRDASWGVIVDSLIVGPGAYVRLYRSADPQSTVLWLMPRQTISDLVERGIPDDVDSIQLLGRAPAEGDPGHAAFVAMTTTQHKPSGLQPPGSSQKQRRS